MTRTQELDVLVIGAGISGLAFAHEHERVRARVAPGERLLVLEASERAGGCLRTRAEAGFRWEEGPEALPANARAVRELCAEAGLATRATPAEASKRFLLSEGKLLEVPSSAEGLSTSRVLSFGAKLRLLAEPTCARDVALDGSIADFARHRFGAEALERVVEPLVAGIHAGDPEQLSLRACFPEVAAMVERHGSVAAALKERARLKKESAKEGAPAADAGGGTALTGALFRPEGGMEALAAALARGLGERVRTDARVLSIERAGRGFRVDAGAAGAFLAARVVLAAPLASARALLAGPAPESAAALESMRSEGLVTVAHAYRRADVAHALDGFGYLAPRAPGRVVLGTLFSSTLDGSAAPAGHVLLRSLLGGARAPETLELSDAEILERVAAECSGPLGISAPPVLARVARWPGVIPRFDLEHLARRERLAAGLPAGLSVLGNFTRALGLEALAADARALARGWSGSEARGPEL